ncbi:aquaporin-like protein [Aspergillus karnatakaensis]|uniref:MIP/aquaporin family protein n=1 Tax=Aspergillus karnatakaensis TaxID=1810916 RepID=UPI003CCCBF6C
MADSGTSRPRAQTAESRLRDEDRQTSRLSPTRSAGGRRPSGILSQPQPSDSNLRRRSTGLSRLSKAPTRSGRLPSATTLRSRSRTQGNFTLAGPEETPQLRMAHEPFVHPGYSDLNPEYEQAPNAKPVWGLAKPLPRVVRPGMVPTKEEVLEAQMNAERPVEQSQNAGLGDQVDANEVEAGRIDLDLDPGKMAAQVDDARAQRENNFVNKLLTGEAGAGNRISGASGSRLRRPSGVAGGTVPTDQLSAVPEGHSGSHTRPDDKAGEGDGAPPDDLEQDLSDEPLHTVHEHPSAEESDGAEEFPQLDESAYPEDLHPLLQDLVGPEIHNNHTLWSVVRTHHREALAESLAVFIQLCVGLSADLSVTLAATTNPNTTAWAWGFAAMMAIYISGGVSGAHLNPTITIMLWFYRGFPNRKMPAYFAAQFLGAFIAALTVYGLYYHSISHYLAFSTTDSPSTNIQNCFITSQRNPWIGPATAFFNEFLGTAILTVTVLALGDDQNAPPGAGMNALVVGLMVYTLSITFSYQTGAAFNPSRDFGPRLALLALGYGGELFTNPYWFYGPWAGSLCGAGIGGLLYDFFIFTGGESPVNYPWERTQRAMRRSKEEWGKRLRGERKKRGEVEKVVV